MIQFSMRQVWIRTVAVAAFGAMVGTFVNGLLTINPVASGPLPAVDGGTIPNGGNGILAGLFAPGGGGIRSGIFRDIDEGGTPDTGAASRQAACIINREGTLICPQLTP